MKTPSDSPWSFASLVWYDIVTSDETFLFRQRIYLVCVLGALVALQCIICYCFMASKSSLVLEKLFFLNYGI